MGTLNLADKKFQALKTTEKPPSKLNRVTRPQFMLAGSLWLIDAIEDHFCRKDHNQNVARTLTRSVQQSLVVDNRHRAEVVTEEIRACLESPQGKTSYLQGEYSVLKWWYRHASGQQPHPSWNYLEKVSGEYTALYHKEHPPPPPHPSGRPVPTHVIPFYIDEKTPTKG